MDEELGCVGFLGVGRALVDDIGYVGSSMGGVGEEVDPVGVFFCLGALGRFFFWPCTVCICLLFACFFSLCFCCFFIPLFFLLRAFGGWGSLALGWGVGALGGLLGAWGRWERGVWG